MGTPLDMGCQIRPTTRCWGDTDVRGSDIFRLFRRKWSHLHVAPPWIWADFGGFAGVFQVSQRMEGAAAGIFPVGGGALSVSFPENPNSNFLWANSAFLDSQMQHGTTLPGRLGTTGWRGRGRTHQHQVCGGGAVTSRSAPQVASPLESSSTSIAACPG